MRVYIKNVLLGFWLVSAQLLLCQNEVSKWYFGGYAALDFMTAPPTPLGNSAMGTYHKCNSIADAAGNLLFYTDGLTVWNRQHTLMPNNPFLVNQSIYGSGPLIVKMPGSASLYYLFYTAPNTNLVSRDIKYCIVDMNLDGGLGDITTNGIIVRTNMTEKLTAVKHCNNKDVWIISHDYNSSNFTANLLTAAGVNTTAVLSPIGMTYTVHYNLYGALKASPNGNRLGNIVRILNAGDAEIYDFDRSTGQLSNQVVLGTNLNSLEGAEFSSDGTKFYASPHNSLPLRQWDLCAGSPGAMAASLFSMNVTVGESMQLAPNGKIYNAGTTNQFISVINNPNAAGAACNFVSAGQALGTGTCGSSLPNLCSWFLQPSFSFTSGLSCQTVSFSAPPPSAGCPAAGSPSLSAITWIFGDPASGATNTSTLVNPLHTFSAPGTYTVKLALNYSTTCVADTQVKVLQTPALPILNVTGSHTLCPGQQGSLTVSGANTYTWSNGAFTSSVVLNPSVTTVYTVSGTFTASGCSSSKTFTVLRSGCTGMEDYKAETLLKVFPNPFQTSFTIDSKKSGTLLVFNALGITVTRYPLNPGLNTIVLQGFSSGIYLLKLEGAHTTGYLKIIKTD